MAEAVAGVAEPTEFEIRGGVWEKIHAIIFYAAVTMAVLASVGVMRVAMGAACVVLLFYSMFAIFSSPTFVIIDPQAREVILENYHYFIPGRRHIGREEIESLEVVESPRIPTAQEEEGSRRDLSYYVRVYLRLKDGGRTAVFRSNMTGAPADNRSKAYLCVEETVAALDIPVDYTRRGSDETGEDA